MNIPYVAAITAFIRIAAIFRTAGLTGSESCVLLSGLSQEKEGENSYPPGGVRKQPKTYNILKYTA